MAILKNGILGLSSGKIGPISTFVLNGQHVARSLRKKRTTSTLAELRSRQATQVITPFLKNVERFTKVGFYLESKKQGTNYYNESYRYNRKYAVAGVYPDLYIDYSKILVSKGDKAPPEDASALFVGNSLEFRWNNVIEGADAHRTDQIMLFAYRRAPLIMVGTIGKYERKDGVALLDVLRLRKPYYLETYISFISELRTEISDSVYLGRILIPAKDQS